MPGLSLVIASTGWLGKLPHVGSLNKAKTGGKVDGTLKPMGRLLGWALPLLQHVMWGKSLYVP